MTAQDWNVASVVAQAAASIAVAIFTALLVRYNRRLLKATEVAAQAALKSSEVAERAMHLSEQPLVQFQGVRIEPRGAISVKTRFSVLVRNYGRGPAEDVILSATLRAAGGSGHSHTRHPFTLAPGQDASLTVGPLSQPVVDALPTRLDISIDIQCEYHSSLGRVVRKYSAVYDHNDMYFAKTEFPIEPDANDDDTPAL